MSFIAKIRRKVLEVAKIPGQASQNFWFAHERRNIKNQRKIIYALTPPPYWPNVGDQAQAIAIHAWLKNHFPTLPVIEVHKDECQDLLPALKSLVGPTDIFFLHSGGNLGDRGKWSESRRRLLITTFPNNQIVSLPQTIYFSDTPIGRQEQENTRRIYATHPKLTIMGRDPRSGEIAAQMFPNAQTFCRPDFVLSMPPREPKEQNNPPKALLCLRLDDESALKEEQRQEIGNRLPYKCQYYDTTLDKPIAAGEREAVLENTLDLFMSSDVVVTDRYHGLIFSVLCRKPCVVISTVDHKLTSAMDWFNEVPFVTLAQSIDEIPALVEHCLAIESREVPDWNAKYFDNIPAIIGLV
ncbi:MAG TPA: polysaccharide pyruvyl transferase family protein [Leptolyngbyaceae cyanobacterium]